MSINRRWTKLATRSLLSLVAILLLSIVVSTTANFVLVHHNRRLFPPPGKLYSIGGYAMHLYCLGTGSPTVILEAGLGDDWLIWRAVQSPLSKATRVCSYDRAGLGWSDPRPEPRDSDHITDELHSLLAKAGVDSPIILMGHSAGGFHIRDYATKHPQGIMGLVFVDASTPEVFDQLPPELNKPAVNLKWHKMQAVLGILRLRGKCGVVDSASQAYAAWLKSDGCLLSTLTTEEREWAGYEPSGRETAGTGPFGAVPVLIFSEDPNYFPPYWTDYFPADSYPSFARPWSSLQERLKRLSTRSRRIVARRSGHVVQIDRPDLVVREVTRMVRSIQGVDSDATDYGSTRTE